MSTVWQRNNQDDRSLLPAQYLRLEDGNETYHDRGSGRDTSGPGFDASSERHAGRCAFHICEHSQRRHSGSWRPPRWTSRHASRRTRPSLWLVARTPSRLALTNNGRRDQPEPRIMKEPPARAALSVSGADSQSFPGSLASTPFTACAQPLSLRVRVASLITGLKRCSSRQLSANFAGSGNTPALRPAR